MATGRIVIDVERCKGCELCIEACPQDVVSLADSFQCQRVSARFAGRPRSSMYRLRTLRSGVP